MVNQLWSNILWGQRGNMMSIPTDCPQRNERLGWTGDAQVFWRTASYNMDMKAFSHKWMVDVRDAQMPNGCYPNIAPAFGAAERECGGAAWSDAGVIIPWTVYRHYGDRTIVDENWKAMDSYMAMVRDSNPSFIVTRPKDRPQFGDWLPADPLARTEPFLIATAYWAYDAALMADMAQGTGRQADAERYLALRDSIRAVFIQTFVQPDGSVGRPFVKKDTLQPGVTQTSIVLALQMGLVPEDKRAGTIARLVRDIEAHGWHLATGFLGTPYLLPVLSEHGRDDVAYKLLFQETTPSWFDMIRNGATTMWEHWNSHQLIGIKDDMNSFNHYAFGAVGEWLYRYMAGIDTDPNEPGFKKIVIRPRPNARLSHVRGEYDSAYGTIVSDWTFKDGVFTLSAVIPPNTSGVIMLPNGERHEVGPGKYTYSVNL